MSEEQRSRADMTEEEAIEAITSPEVKIVKCLAETLQEEALKPKEALELLANKDEKVKKQLLALGIQSLVTAFQPLQTLLKSTKPQPEPNIEIY